MAVALARFARAVVRLGRDRIAPRSGFPRGVDELDAPYLSAPRAAVEDEVLTTTDGTTDGSGSARDDVPASVFIKMAPAAAVTRLFVDLADLGTGEIGFYRDVRPTLELEAPVALGSQSRPPASAPSWCWRTDRPRPAFGEVLPVDVASAEARLDTLAPPWFAVAVAATRSPLAPRPRVVQANSETRCSRS
jgi:hypothetical protein